MHRMNKLFIKFKGALEFRNQVKGLFPSLDIPQLNETATKDWIHMLDKGLQLYAFYFYSFNQTLTERTKIFKMKFVLHQTSECQLHRAGLAVGTLCHPLCIEGEIHSLTCHSLHAGKEAVFSAKWGSSRIVFKGVPLLGNEWPETHVTTHPSSSISEDRFRAMLRDVIATKLNASVTSEQLDRLASLGLRTMPREKEMRALWPLVHDNEYLCSILYRELDVFPQVVGTCGSFFAVEFAEPVQSMTSTSGSRAEIRAAWVERVRIAVMILDLLDELDTDLPEPFHLCDVKSSHFGLVHGGHRVKFLDLDAVAPRGMVDHITGDNSPCTKNEDCDYFDCRSRCNEGRCRSPVVNDNHQVVCEKVFLGWTLRGAVIIPGLLMSEHTPSPLASLLRLCANPEMDSNSPRASVPEDIKHRLYATLSELSRQLSEQQSAAES